MSFEYSSKIDQKINLQEFIKAINNSDVFLANCLNYDNDRIQIGFKFYNIPDHSWGDDAVMEVNNNQVYISINAGDLKQQGSLITAIQNCLKFCGVSAELEEL